MFKIRFAALAALILGAVASVASAQQATQAGLGAAVPDGIQLAEDRGWSEIAEGGVEIHETPGGHQTVFEPQNVSTLARKLEACLRAALSRQAKP